VSENIQGTLALFLCRRVSLHFCSGAGDTRDVESDCVGRCFLILYVFNLLILVIVILLIRTYAFFDRNLYVLLFLISALVGVAAYQLYVATSQMLCTLFCCSVRP
jgi:hypothetical protein